MIRNKIVKDDIIVRKSILHILNSGSGQIGLATNLIDMGPDLFDMIRALSIRQEIWLNSCLISCVIVFRFRQQICFVLVFR